MNCVRHTGTVLVLALLAMPAAAMGEAADNKSAAASSAVMRLCDTLAADPSDVAKPKDVPGVALDKIDATTAGAACEAAVALAPEEPRMSYNLGRASVAAGNFIDAIGPLRAASEAGHAAAHRTIGDMYAKGQGFAVDPAKADEFYAMAAAAGDTAAGLAKVDALLATGGAEDRTEALELLRLAADNGSAEASYRLGLELQQFDGVFRHGTPEELKQAHAYLAAAAEQGWPGARRAMVELGLVAAAGLDETKAFEDLIAFAEAGDPWAMTELAQSIATSSVGPWAKLDPTEQFEAEVEWLTKAAALDDPRAVYALSFRYGGGVGVAEDQNESARLLQRAAELGYPEAQSDLGFKIYRAAGTDEQYRLAASWFEKAKEGGSSDGAVGLGHLYSTGAGLPFDLEQAIVNYTVGLEQGFNPIAAYELARIYDKERGYQDPAKAADYLIRAINEAGGITEERAAAGLTEFSRETRIALQSQLIARGLLKGSADGVFGPASFKAFLKSAPWRD